MFTAALFTIAKTWKQPKHPSTDEWIKMWGVVCMCVCVCVCICICMCACTLSCFSLIQFFATLWTVACQGPLPMGFSRQEYWSGLPCPPPGDLPHPGIKSAFLMPPALAGEF